MVTEKLEPHEPKCPCIMGSAARCTLKSNNRIALFTDENTPVSILSPSCLPAHLELLNRRNQERHCVGFRVNLGRACMMQLHAMPDKNWVMSPLLKNGLLYQ